jgi:molybdate transport system ATP-binding protein
VTLDAEVRVRIGGFDLDAALAAGEGETVAVLGPNGAGKTTLLRTLAGLQPLAGGRIVLGGSVLDDGARTFVPPERRAIGVVFQDSLLFPHLSVLENVAFGLRSRGRARRDARREAHGWLDRVGLADRAGSSPRELSGGQAQRVALVRALASDPLLVLLDEPLAALDQTARVDVRRQLRSDLGSFTGVRVVVTHEPLDAAALADRLVVVEHGRVVQVGTFAEVSARPRSPYVADLVGVNLLRGRARGDRVELTAGALVVTAGATGGGEVLAVIHPRAVALHRDRPAGSPRNVAEGRVRSIERLGERVRVEVDGAVPLVAEVTPAALDELALREGAPVWTSVKATEITVFPA